MSHKYSWLLLIMLSQLALPLYSEDNGGKFSGEPFLALRIVPNFGIPLGRDRKVFMIDVGRDVSLRYALPFFRPLFLDFTFGSYLSLVRADVAALILSFSCGLGVSFPLGRYFLLGGFLRFGGFYCLVRNEERRRGGQAMLRTGPVFGIIIKRFVSLDFETSYKKYFGFSDQLAMGLGLSFHFNR